MVEVIGEGNVALKPQIVKLNAEIKQLTLNSKDLINNSPYYMSDSSCDVSLDSLVLDQLIIL